MVTSSDQVNVFVAKQRELIEAFSSHTELDENSETTLTHWVDTNARSWFSTKYDRDEMTELIMGDSLPRDLLGTLPAALFSGMLVQNRLLRVCRRATDRSDAATGERCGPGTSDSARHVYPWKGRARPRHGRAHARNPPHVLPRRGCGTRQGRVKGTRAQLRRSCSRVAVGCDAGPQRPNA